MKLFCFVLFCLLSMSVKSQTITTIAGSGINGDSGDGGSAIDAELNYPIRGAFDNKNNYYFVEWNGNRVRKINPFGIISTVAGSGIAGFSGDGGPASLAKLNSPFWVTTDRNGNLFIADKNNNRIRMIDTFGIIQTIAGNGIDSSLGDGGLATSASLISPTGVCIDRIGYIYITEDRRIRKIDTNGIIYTIAGTAVAGFSGDGGLADTAVIDCGAIYVDNNFNIYIQNIYRIRKIYFLTGIINTIAGTNSCLYNGDGISADSANFDPQEFSFDSNGNIYIADYYNSRIRKIDTTGIIHTVAGNGVAGFFGDGGIADSAELYRPAGVNIDACGNLYITDELNSRIRKITFDSACTTHTLSLPPEKLEAKLTLYPTPTYDVLHIDNLPTAATYALLSMVGAVMQQGALRAGSNSVNVRGLATGVYMLNLTPALSTGGKGVRTVYRVLKE